MKWASLEEVCEINVGRTPARAEPSFWGTGHRWLSIADMNQGISISTTKEQITDAGARAGMQVEPGTVLLSFKLSIGKVGIAQTPLYTNEAIAALPVKDPRILEPRFLVRALQATDLTGESNRAAMGATLNKRSLAKVRVPLPPLAEQRRIAALLDHADALRAKRRNVLAHLDTLTQAIFHSMFGDADCVAAHLSDVAEVKGGKRLPKGAAYADEPTSHPYIRVTDLRDGAIQTAELCYLPNEVQRLIARYTVDHDDVVISIAGSIGLTAAVPAHLAGANLTENAAKIVSKKPARYCGAWLSDALQTGDLQAQIASRVGQVTIGKLALFRIEQLELTIPPLEAQQEYLTRRDQVDQQRSVVKRALAADDELFASLQARAFRGEL